MEKVVHSYIAFPAIQYMDFSKIVSIIYFFRTVKTYKKSKDFEISQKNTKNTSQYFLHYVNRFVFLPPLLYFTIKNTIVKPNIAMYRQNQFISIDL